MPLRMADLRDVDPAESGVFGGKAAGLARLIAAGARVPAGFAVEAAPAEAWTEQDRVAVRERSILLLANGPVAVRSSAVGEDSASRSFAGLLETVLDVADAEGLRAAVSRCIASGGSERVQAYAGSAWPLRVGVVVQSMVEARAAGVCFTVDPGGKDRAVLVEAVPGTGDALVSGRTPPERWRVYSSGLGGWETRRDPMSAASALADGEAERVAAGAASLAASFGRPLDLEWAIDREGVLHWLQARPITAATPPAEYDVLRFFDGVDDGPVTVWANWNVREVLPDPFEPFEWTLWRDEVLPAVAAPLFGVSSSSPLFPHVVCLDLVHGRVYWNMNALVGGPLGRLSVRMLSAIDARAGAVTTRLMAEGVLRPRRLPGSRWPLRFAVLRAGLAQMAGFLSGLRAGRVMERMAACAEAVRRRPEVAGLGDRELLEEMRFFASPEAEALRDGQTAMAVALLVFVAAERAFRDHPEARRRLAAGIVGNPTTQISLGIEELVEAARPLAAFFAEPGASEDLLGRLAAAPAGVAWIARLRLFLDRFGHRCPSEFDLGAPRWIEDPTMILELVRAGIASPPGEGVAGRLVRLGQERREAVRAAVGSVAPWRRPLLRWLAGLVERYMPLREAPKHYAMVIFLRMRRAALELGARLVARGVVDAPGDVFFLEWREVQHLALGAAAGGDRRGLVRERRGRFVRYTTERAPDFLRSDGVPVFDEAEAAGAEPGVLRGVGTSGGTATGPVRILREPDPRQMADGDVVVVEFADPGWTPLFPRAAAVVMEVGGVMCHAAVVARELGIPAVFGVHGATTLLEDGQVVTVDGDGGTVRVA